MKTISILALLLLMLSCANMPIKSKEYSDHAINSLMPKQNKSINKGDDCDAR